MKTNLIKLFGLLSLASLSVVHTKAQTIDNLYNWSEAPSISTPIQEIYPAIYNEEIYISGGYVPSQKPVFFGLSPTRLTFIFNLGSQQWRKGPQLPEERHHLGLVSNSDYLYGVGGFYGQQGKAWQIQNTVYRLDITSNTWQKGPELPIPLAESVYVSVGNNIHVIGGKTISPETGKHADTKKHYVLVDNTRWVEATEPSIVRSSAASAVLDNKIYVIGGRESGVQSSNKQFAEVYDVKKDKWTAIKPFPVALAGMSASVLNGKIIVSGGEAFGPNGNWREGKASNQVWAFDPATENWSEISTMPSARHGHGSVTLNNKIYIMGGAAKVGPQDTLATTLILAKD
ncbi:kelch repeat-containing protein [uncultured Shewanella sp.]|uniref:Kelch repeat-containing protein n=1 Tax=uncultured Shewanella sp. TaxID=173975 RepID=UPI0026171BED|nr:kelch repeat-containing protein [uncultured Shewanella sp.]